MRQYEREDCLEDAVLNHTYNVVSFSSSRDCLNQSILTLGFVNKKTNNIVWVPYGSQILIQDSLYTVNEGKDDQCQGRRMTGFNKSVWCLTDKSDQPEFLYNFLGEQVVVTRLPDQYLSSDPKINLYNTISSQPFF